MKVDEFLGNRDPGDETEHVEVTDPDFQHVTSLTPSGVEVLYSWAPKRLYRLRRLVDFPEFEEKAKAGLNGHEILEVEDWVEVSSVTNVLKVIDRSGPLIWWGQGIGGIGTLKLQSVGQDLSDVNGLLDCGDDDGARKALCTHLTAHKISTNHAKDEAADRGVNVHNALEAFCVDQTYRPNRDLYEDHEQGYIDGLSRFLDDVCGVSQESSIGVPPDDIQAEVMVGSLQHGYAGRYDLRFTLTEPVELVTKTYPKRADKREIVDAGTYLLDLKSSKGVYTSHAAQLAAYELASIECGYGATDCRAVIHVTSEGKYEFVRTHAQPEDFLSILQAYNTMQNAKAWL